MKRTIIVKITQEEALELLNTPPGKMHMIQELLKGVEFEVEDDQ